MVFPHHSMDKSGDTSEKYVATNLPPPEWIENSTCYTPELLNVEGGTGEFTGVTVEDAFKFVLLCISSILTVFFNILFIVVINQSGFKRRWIRQQPRYIFVSIAVNDLIMGLLMLFLSTYPALYKCWPFGKNLCQLQVSTLDKLHILGGM